MKTTIYVTTILRTLLNLFEENPVHLLSILCASIYYNLLGIPDTWEEPKYEKHPTRLIVDLSWANVIQ